MQQSNYNKTLATTNLLEFLCVLVALGDNLLMFYRVADFDVF